MSRGILINNYNASGQASDVIVKDVGNYYESSNLEEVLREIAVGKMNVTEGGTIDPDQLPPNNDRNNVDLKYISNTNTLVDTRPTETTNITINKTTTIIRYTVPIGGTAKWDNNHTFACRILTPAPDSIVNIKIEWKMGVTIVSSMERMYLCNEIDSLIVPVIGRLPRSIDFEAGTEFTLELTLLDGGVDEITIENSPQSPTYLARNVPDIYSAASIYGVGYNDEIMTQSKMNSQFIEYNDLRRYNITKSILTPTWYRILTSSDPKGVVNNIVNLTMNSGSNAGNKSLVFVATGASNNNSLRVINISGPNINCIQKVRYVYPNDVNVGGKYIDILINNIDGNFNPILDIHNTSLLDEISMKVVRVLIEAPEIPSTHTFTEIDVYNSTDSGILATKEYVDNNSGGGSGGVGINENLFPNGSMVINTTKGTSFSGSKTLDNWYQSGGVLSKKDNLYNYITTGELGKLSCRIDLDYIRKFAGENMTLTMEGNTNISTQIQLPSVLDKGTSFSLGNTTVGSNFVMDLVKNANEEFVSGVLTGTATASSEPKQGILSTDGANIPFITDVQWNYIYKKDNVYLLVGDNNNNRNNNICHVSIDDGVTWNNIEATDYYLDCKLDVDSNFPIYSFEPYYDNKIIIGAKSISNTSCGYIEINLDDPTTFTYKELVADGAPYEYCVMAINKTKLYAILYNTASSSEIIDVKISEDGGTTWTDVTKNFNIDLTGFKVLSQPCIINDNEISIGLYCQANGPFMMRVIGNTATETKILIDGIDFNVTQIYNIIFDGNVYNVLLVTATSQTSQTFYSYTANTDISNWILIYSQTLDFSQGPPTDPVYILLGYTSGVYIYLDILNSFNYSFYNNYTDISRFITFPEDAIDSSMNVTNNEIISLCSMNISGTSVPEEYVSFTSKSGYLNLDSKTINIPIEGFMGGMAYDGNSIYYSNGINIITNEPGYCYSTDNGNTFNFVKFTEIFQGLFTIYNNDKFITAGIMLDELDETNIAISIVDKNNINTYEIRVIEPIDMNSAGDFIIINYNGFYVMHPMSSTYISTSSVIYISSDLETWTTVVNSQMDNTMITGVNNGKVGEMFIIAMGQDQNTTVFKLDSTGNSTPVTITGIEGFVASLSYNVNKYVLTTMIPSTDPNASIPGNTNVYTSADLNTWTLVSDNITGVFRSDGQINNNQIFYGLGNSYIKYTSDFENYYNIYPFIEGNIYPTLSSSSGGKMFIIIETENGISIEEISPIKNFTPASVDLKGLKFEIGTKHTMSIPDKPSFASNTRIYNTAQFEGIDNVEDALTYLMNKAPTEEYEPLQIVQDNFNDQNSVPEDYPVNKVSRFRSSSTWNNYYGGCMVETLCLSGVYVQRVYFEDTVMYRTSTSSYRWDGDWIEMPKTKITTGTSDPTSFVGEDVMYIVY